jgi:hypothetical protein
MGHEKVHVPLFRRPKLFLLALGVALLSGCGGLSGGNSQNGSGPGSLTPNPASVSFGSIAVGGTAHINESLTNTGGTAVTISQSQVSEDEFSLSGLNLPITLNPNQSVTFTVIFTPAFSGNATATLTITSDQPNSPLTVALSGTGGAQGQLSISPSTLNFGSVAVGGSSSQTAHLNAASASVTVSSATVDSNEFSITGLTFPTTIAPGDSATFTVTFTPGAAGNASGRLTVASDASNSPGTQSLTGNGQAPSQHWADLTWDAESGAISYNVYRKLSTDPGYTQIDSGQSSASYADNNVSAGQTYSYVVTAVNSKNQESGYSNVAQVQIPTP